MLGRKRYVLSTISMGYQCLRRNHELPHLHHLRLSAATDSRLHRRRWIPGDYQPVVTKGSDKMTMASAPMKYYAQIRVTLVANIVFTASEEEDKEKLALKILKNSYGDYEDADIIELDYDMSPGN